MAAVSCNKDIAPEGADTTTVRAALSPDPGSIPAAGGSFESVVIVNQGMKLNVGWTLSVDGTPDWLNVSKVTLKTNFDGTYDGDDREVEQPGISCTVGANATGKKRVAVIRFTTADGRSDIYTLTQSAK